ncbi:MAG: hypothetical protein K2G71_07345, partial [Duncaniella sp.]|nr:hypothetical protein [Duncaniella sp.]
VTLIGKVLPADSLQLAMSSQLKNYGLEGTRLNIIQGDSPDLSEIKNGLPTVKDIYELAQTSISAQQVVIDSLKSVIAINQINDTIAGRIAPEIRVVFPQVEELAVTHTIFSNIATERLDTINTVLVKYNTPLPPAKEKELIKYLEARLQHKSLQLINVGNQLSFSTTQSHQTKK